MAVMYDKYRDTLGDLDDFSVDPATAELVASCKRHLDAARRIRELERQHEEEMLRLEQERLRDREIRRRIFRMQPL